MKFKKAKEIVVPPPEIFLTSPNYRAIKQHYIRKPSYIEIRYGDDKEELRQCLIIERRTLNVMGEAIWSSINSSMAAEELLKEIGKFE